MEHGAPKPPHYVTQFLLTCLGCFAGILAFSCLILALLVLAGFLS